MIDTNEYYLFKKNQIKVGDIVTIIDMNDIQLLYNPHTTDTRRETYGPMAFRVPGTINSSMLKLAGTSLIVTEINGSTYVNWQSTLHSGEHLKDYIRPDSNYNTTAFCRNSVGLTVADSRNSDYTELQRVCRIYRFNTTMLKKVNIDRVDSAGSQCYLNVEFINAKEKGLI